VDPTLYESAPAYNATEEETERGTRYLRHNDIIRLYHVTTNSFLLTHDVASPLTTTNMEFTTFVTNPNNTAERYLDTLFRVVVEKGNEGDKVKSRRHHLKLLSVPHKVATFTSRKSKLPEWGFGQQEVNGNKKVDQDSNIWFFDDVMHERIVNGTMFIFIISVCIYLFWLTMFVALYLINCRNGIG
jgi:dolichyl-phosphate-mannose-protein mannosyltransferase